MMNGQESLEIKAASLTSHLLVSSLDACIPVTTASDLCVTLKTSVTSTEPGNEWTVSLTELLRVGARQHQVTVVGCCEQ